MRNQIMKSIAVTLILTISLMSTGCLTKLVPDKKIEMTFMYDNSISTFRGDDYEKHLDWIYTQDGEEKVLESSILFNNPEIDEILIMEKTKNSLKFKFQDEVFEFQNIEAHDKQLSWTITGKNKEVAFSAIDPTGEFSNFLDNLKPGEKVYLPAVGPIIRVIIKAGILIYRTYHFICDLRVRNGAEECTRMGKCTQVHSCSVTCIDCGG